MGELLSKRDQWLKDTLQIFNWATLNGKRKMLRAIVLYRVFFGWAYSDRSVIKLSNETEYFLKETFIK